MFDVWVSHPWLSCQRFSTWIALLQTGTIGLALDVWIAHPRFSQVKYRNPVSLDHITLRGNTIRSPGQSAATLPSPLCVFDWITRPPEVCCSRPGESSALGWLAGEWGVGLFTPYLPSCLFEYVHLFTLHRVSRSIQSEKSVI